MVGSGLVPVKPVSTFDKSPLSIHIIICGNDTSVKVMYAPVVIT